MENIIFNGQYKIHLFLLYCLLGPVVAWVILQTMEIVYLYDEHDPLRENFVFYSLLLLMVSYMLASGPALVCGFFMGQKWITRTPVFKYYITGFCMGALVSTVIWGGVWFAFVIAAALGGGWESVSGVWGPATWLFAFLIGIGGVCSLVCTIVEHKFLRKYKAYC